jgi:hypothetical protein
VVAPQDQNPWVADPSKKPYLNPEPTEQDAEMAAERERVRLNPFSTDYAKRKVGLLPKSDKPEDAVEPSCLATEGL